MSASRLRCASFASLLALAPALWALAVGALVAGCAEWTCPGLVDTAVKGLEDRLLGFRPVSAEQSRGYQG